MVTYNHFITNAQQAWMIFEKFLPKEIMETQANAEKFPVKIYRIESPWFSHFQKSKISQFSVWAIKVSEANYCGVVFNSGIKNDDGELIGGVFISFSENNILRVFRNRDFVSDYVYIEKEQDEFKLCRRFFVTNSVEAWKILSQIVPQRKISDIALVKLNHYIDSVNFGWAVLNKNFYLLVCPIDGKCYDVKGGDIEKFCLDGERVHPLFRLRFKHFYYLKLDRFPDRKA